jgi:hypothetical protein
MTPKEVKIDGMIVPVPESRNIAKDSVKTYKGATKHATATFITHSVQNVDEVYHKEEPDDQALSLIGAPTYTKPATPDGWIAAFYPHGGDSNKRPNMHALKEWVVDVKLAKMTTYDLQLEYGKVFNKKVPTEWDKKMKDNLIDTIAFLVARKIWYVGRKPKSMYDWEWDDATRDERPAQGSFSKNEHWANGFPYTRSYKYKSWGHEEELELKNTGKLKW